MKRLFFVLFPAVLLSVVGASAYAQGDSQSNFSVSPPPIAAPDFTAGKEDRSVVGTYVSMTGEGLEFTGLGANFIFRKATSDQFAVDFIGGAFVMSGTMDMSFDTGMGSPTTIEGDMTMMNIPFGLNGEFQLANTPQFSMILFGGLNMSIGSSYLTFSYTVPRTCVLSYCYGGYTETMYSDTTTMMFGFTGGGQASLKLGDIIISPFLMMQTMSGSATTSTDGSSMTVDIPSFTMTSYGLDILFVPLNISLSSILQKAAESNEESKGFETNMYQLTFHF